MISGFVMLIRLVMFVSVFCSLFWCVLLICCVSIVCRVGNVMLFVVNSGSSVNGIYVVVVNVIVMSLSVLFVRFSVSVWCLLSCVISGLIVNVCVSV